MSNIILVDTSYTSFYRYFATLRWISHSNKELYKEKKAIPNYDWGQEKIFIEKYDKMYLESIKKLVGKKIFTDCHIIFCMDSPQKDIWRNKLIKDYKGDRVDLSLKNNFKEIFRETYNRLIPNIIKNNPNKIHKIKVDTTEADDIIAVISKFYKLEYPNKKIYIISGDEDFLQLGRDNLFFITYKKKKLLCLTKQESEKFLEYKIIKGDISDNIPSIFNKIPLNIKKELLINKDKFEKYLKDNPDVKKRYILNKKLIDFDYIPKSLQKNIFTEYKKLGINH